MKRRDILATFAGAAVPGSAQTSSFALQFRDGFLKHWEVERGYTLAVAEAMPAEHYNFKPHAVQRTHGFGPVPSRLHSYGAAPRSSYCLSPNQGQHTADVGLRTDGGLSRP